MLKVNYWIQAARPQTLVASLAPVICSSFLCYKYYQFNFLIFFLTVLSAVLIQIMTNFINDLYDFKKGADKENRLGPDRMIQKGFISENEIKNAILLLLLLSVFTGLYLVIIGGWIILVIGLSSFLFAYLYTATKFSIAYNGLGEVFVFLYFGLIAAIGTAYLQTHSYLFDSLVIGCIFGFLNMSLLIINNLRDVNVPPECYSSDDWLIYQVGKSYTLPLLALNQRLATRPDNKQEANKDEEVYDEVVAQYHNKIYDILATTCTRKWWETQSKRFTADDILSWGSTVHNDMIIKLPQYDTKI